MNKAYERALREIANVLGFGGTLILLVFSILWSMGTITIPSIGEIANIILAVAFLSYAATSGIFRIISWF